MKVYGLFVPAEGKYLAPKSSGNTDEFVMENNDMCLVEHCVDAGYGKYKYRFRLHTGQPARFEDTLEYDIACPRCHTYLRLCGRPLDAYDHGLYKCPACDKH